MREPVDGLLAAVKKLEAYWLAVHKRKIRPAEREAYFLGCASVAREWYLERAKRGSGAV